MQFGKGVAAAVLLGLGALARGAEPPADLCSLLPVAEVAGAVHLPFGAVTRSAAPRPFPKSASGTDCSYGNAGKPADGRLLFRAYVDASVEEAIEQFGRLGKVFSPHTPVAAIGDAAYIDSQHALHVRKGKVRFYLVLDSGAAADDRALEALGRAVAGKL